MLQAPYFDVTSATVRFWVPIDDVPIGASIHKVTLHYLYKSHMNDDDALATYLQNSAVIGAAVRRRVAAGSREPVILQDADVRAVPGF